MAVANESAPIEEAQDSVFVNGARSAERAARRLKDRVVSGTQERIDDSRDLIRENPLKSVFIAAGVGALVGYLTARRR